MFIYIYTLDSGSLAQQQTMAEVQRKNFSIVIIFILMPLSSYTGESSPPFACNPSNAITRTLPFCSNSLQISDRVQDLIGRLTLHEKISLLANNATPVERLGIKGFEWWSEGLHGVAKSPGVHFGGEFPGATSFPQVITSVASFNASLWEQIGGVVSNEARAMYNGGMAGLTLWSPNVNIFRDPRWGRGQETPGEDPLVASKYAVSYVRGLQSPVGNRLKVAACCKHFTAYDLDKWNDVDRYHFNAKVSKQDLEETFNVPFKACVLEGKVAGIMCSYNQVNGKPTCADPRFLRGTLRDQWRLNGYIVSDCDSVDTFFNQQHYTATPEDAVAVAIKAGLDLDCGPFLATYTEQAIGAGKVSEADVNGALANTLTVQMRLGMFDGTRQPYRNLGSNDVCTPAHKQLALEAARQGIVLLKNRYRSLPLASTRYQTIAVIGPHSDSTENVLGNYAGVPCNYITPLEGIGKYARTTHESGCIDVACNSSQQFEAAEGAARQADATVLLMGLDQSIEAEDKDRLGLLLPGLQQELVSKVAKVSKGPTILVLISGGPIDVTFAKNDPRIASILWAGYPGQAGGAAIADIVFGITNPGARLPMTWYPQEYVAKVPMTDMDMRADPAKGYPGRTYKFYKGPVVFPFGFGLSYTTFEVLLVHAPTIVSVPVVTNKAFENETWSRNAIRVSHINCDAMNLSMHFNVKNVGEMDGTHSLLLFSTPPTDELGPIKQLVSFNKVHVFVGAQQSIRVGIDVCKHLTIVDRFGIRRLPMGVHSLQFGDLEHFILLQAAVEEVKSYR